MNEVLKKIEEAAQPILEKYQLVLYKSETRNEYSNQIYTIYVDDPKSFDIDIDKVTAINQELLDIVNDFLPDNGYLEVSSVGIERPIVSEDDYQKAIGKYIYCSLYEKLADIGLKEVTGDLVKVTDDFIEMDIMMKTKQKHITIERKKIANARLAVKF